jgi:methionine synthase II (cobalamin-independent)
MYSINIINSGALRWYIVYNKNVINTIDVINTINLDVYDVDIRRHKHDQLRCLWRRYSTINLDVYDVDIRRHKHDQLRCLWRRYSTS